MTPRVPRWSSATWRPMLRSRRSVHLNRLERVSGVSCGGVSGGGGNDSDGSDGCGGGGCGVSSGDGGGSNGCGGVSGGGGCGSYGCGGGGGSDIPSRGSGSIVVTATILSYCK